MSHVKLVTCAPVERSAVSCCCVSKPPRTHNWQSRLSRLNFSKAATPAVDHAKKIMFPLLRRDDLAVCDYSQGTVHFTRVRLSAILATRSNVPSWPTSARCRRVPEPGPARRAEDRSRPVVAGRAIESRGADIRAERPFRTVTEDKTSVFVVQHGSIAASASTHQPTTGDTTKFTNCELGGVSSLKRPVGAGFSSGR
jgi:hypothetical protein